MESAENKTMEWSEPIHNTGKVEVTCVAEGKTSGNDKYIYSSCVNKDRFNQDSGGSGKKTQLEFINQILSCFVTSLHKDFYS